MKKRDELLMSLVVAIILFFSASFFASASQNRGYVIAKKMEKAADGFKGEKGKMTMTLINAYGDKIIRKLDYKIKETKNDGDKSISEFLWPADVKGTKMLSWSHKKKSDSQWLYLPSLKRVRRISSRSRSGSFMGSEFAYEDISGEEIEKYTYKFLKEEKINGRKCWVNERYPVDKKSGYSKQVTWIDQEYMAFVKIEYYDRKGELLKTSKSSGYKKVSGYWRAATVHMVNNQTAKESILAWSNRKLGMRYSDINFDPDTLED